MNDFHLENNTGCTIKIQCFDPDFNKVREGSKIVTVSPGKSVCYYTKGFFERITGVKLEFLYKSLRETIEFTVNADDNQILVYDNRVTTKKPDCDFACEQNCFTHTIKEDLLCEFTFNLGEIIRDINRDEEIRQKTVEICRGIDQDQDKKNIRSDHHIERNRKRSRHRERARGLRTDEREATNYSLERKRDFQRYEDRPKSKRSDEHRRFEYSPTRSQSIPRKIYERREQLRKKVIGFYNQVTNINHPLQRFLAERYYFTQHVSFLLLRNNILLLQEAIKFYKENVDYYFDRFGTRDHQFETFETALEDCINDEKLLISELKIAQKLTESHNQLMMQKIQIMGADTVNLPPGCV